MFYRVEIRLDFATVDSPDDLFDKALDALEKAIIINPGQPNEERGYIQVQQCFHDEDPTLPCVVIRHIEPE